MSKSLEARLIIAAEDRTKAAFDAIAHRMDRLMAKARDFGRVTEIADRALDTAGAALGRVDRSLATAATRLERAAASMDRAAASTSRAGRAAAGPGVGTGGRGHSVPVVVNRGHYGPAVAASFGTRHGTRHMLARGGYGVGGLAGGVAAVAAGEALTHGVEKGAERDHERVRMDISGMMPWERDEAEKYAAVLSGRYASIAQTQIMHTLRNARSVTGSYAEASDVADDLLRTRLVAQAARPGQDVEGDFDKLIKGMEQYGVTQHPKAFREAMKRVQKVLAVEGDTLTADSIYQSFKYSRQALPKTSQRFMLGTAPAISQEMGGSSFGNALSAFNQALVQGRMSGRSLKLALDLGLIEKRDLNLDRHGAPSSVKTVIEGGDGFKGWQVAQSDPDLYVWNYLDKALKQHGIVDPAEVTQIASTLFGNRMAGDLVGKFLTQRSRIEKNQENLAKAPDDPAARIIAGDPINAWQGVKASFDNVSASILSSGGAIPDALNRISTYLNDGAARLQGVKTDHAQQVENFARLGIDSPVDFSKQPAEELIAAREKAAKDNSAAVIAKNLELKGVREELARREAERAAGGFWSGLGFGGTPTSPLVARALQIQTDLKALDEAAARLKEIGAGQPHPSFVRPGEKNADALALGGFLDATTYKNIDPATGRPWGVPAPRSLPAQVSMPAAPSPYGSLAGAKASLGGPIEATLKGQATVDVKVSVEPSSALLSVVERAKKVSSSGDIAATTGGAGKTPLNVGSGAPGTGPAGRTPSGR